MRPTAYHKELKRALHTVILRPPQVAEESTLNVPRVVRGNETQLLRCPFATLKGFGSE